MSEAENQQNKGFVVGTLKNLINSMRCASGSDDVTSSEFTPEDPRPEDVESSNSDGNSSEYLSEDVNSPNSTLEYLTPYDSDVKNSESPPNSTLEDVENSEDVTSEFEYTSDEILNIRGIPPSGEYMEKLEFLKMQFEETSKTMRKKTFNFWKPARSVQYEEFRRRQNFDSSGDYPRQNQDSEFRRRQNFDDFEFRRCSPISSPESTSSYSPYPHLNLTSSEFRLRHSRYRDSGIFDVHRQKRYSNQKTSLDFEPLNIRSFEYSPEYVEYSRRRAKETIPNLRFRTFEEYFDEDFGDSDDSDDSECLLNHGLNQFGYSGDSQPLLEDLNQYPEDSYEEVEVARHQNDDEPVEENEDPAPLQNWYQARNHRRHGVSRNLSLARHQNQNGGQNFQNEDPARLQNWNQQENSEHLNHSQYQNGDNRWVNEAPPPVHQNWNQNQNWNQHYQNQHRQGPSRNLSLARHQNQNNGYSVQNAPATHNGHTDNLEYPNFRSQRNQNHYYHNHNTYSVHNGQISNGSYMYQPPFAYGLAPNQPFRPSFTPIKTAEFDPETNDYHYG